MQNDYEIEERDHCNRGKTIVIRRTSNLRSASLSKCRQKRGFSFTGEVYKARKNLVSEVK